ncbi:MAG: hypothetical protein IPM51_10740 [Sphingobacteriaceae bacterium]|nr:hypothetical protein [Sphingobacteriaceae bacterium]
MKSNSILKLILLMAIVITACKKEGTGGSTTVATLVAHHAKRIPSAMVYVKYGAKDFPGSDVSKYDASELCDKDGHAHFENLQKGDYYFYGVGYDSAISMPVYGGAPVKITRKDKGKHIDVDIAVVE